MIRLNLACGDEGLPGYINIDIRNGPHINLHHDCLTELPYGDEAVDEILVEDFLEHIPPTRRQSVLFDWWRVLKMEGLLTVRVPNLESIAQQLLDFRGNPHRQELLIRNIYGGHRWGKDGEYDCHHAGWTPELLKRMLSEHGFQQTANDEALNMKVEAIKVRRLGSQEP